MKSLEQVLTPEVLEKYQALIFDLDGTLLNTIPAHEQAWEETGRRFNKTFDVEIMHRLTGSSAVFIAEEICKDAGVAPELVPDVLQTKVDIASQYIADKTEALPAYHLAHKYKGSKKLGIGTGSFRHFVDLLDKKFALYELMGKENTFSQDDVSKHKPDPETWLSVAKSLNVEPQNCLVFEDGTLGMQGALACGMDAFDVVNNKLYYAKDYSNLEEIKQALAKR
ncbi:hypothetical protein CKF54_04650 [Psittacicella hinzii]|uniref:Uncharacterized protein n=1 Tax=Psittacicella hinzii TaxID=2028575 RepID=A0A3A1Y5M3_9GAMM|nr:HAD-IA family hydrolase [Psittacicella hinzii]RIY32508.1 hypothetical protein CKF54_04650 [Psittacicella hinzii]